MGKAERNRRQSAQEKIAAQRAAARRAERRRQALLAGGSVIAVIAIVVAFVLVKALSKPAASASAASAGGTALAANVVGNVTGVPTSALDAVGTGTTYKGAIQVIKGGAPLTSGGKPEVVYVGAEYCPYCAAERWAMTIALSRFGTFSGLHFIHSAPSPRSTRNPHADLLQVHVHQQVPGLLGHRAADREVTPLQTLTTLDNQLMGKYDVPPYVPSAQYDESFPFVDFGNKFVIDGASYSPQMLAGADLEPGRGGADQPASPMARRWTARPT